MKNFLAIYLGTEAARARWDQLDEQERNARTAKGIKAWNDWVAAHSASIAEIGGPLGKTKRAGADGLTDVRNAMAAFTIVRAESHEAAAKLFENHPHFTIFPGDCVEIMECLPIPGR